MSNKEKQYKDILMAIVENALLGRNEKVRTIISNLDIWRYNIVNSCEGDNDKTYNKRIENSLNNVLNDLY